jgi:hypothetical protein
MIDCALYGGYMGAKRPVLTLLHRTYANGMLLDFQPTLKNNFVTC